MPVKSAKQFKFMSAIAHGAKSYSNSGPSPEIAKEFVKETPREKRSMFMKDKKKRNG